MWFTSGYAYLSAVCRSGPACFPSRPGHPGHRTSQNQKANEEREKRERKRRHKKGCHAVGLPAVRYERTTGVSNGDGIPPAMPAVILPVVK